ncbi:MAG: alpha/beta hydrolase, partial [Firmicutes bacterium]|nr:alpha/beta hydrolase [Bacillota bacterium]
MFRYFPDNMMWSQTVMFVLNCGGEIGEIDGLCRSLVPKAAASDEEAWYEGWRQLADRVASQAEQDRRLGHAISAGNKFRRAAAYYMAAERILDPYDTRKLDTYRRFLDAFREAVTLGSEAVEWVSVPYLEGKELPALFVPAAGPPPWPTAIFVDGFDITKEIIYLRRIREASRRGIALLIVDTPGVGESLRLLGLPARPDTEVPVKACVDYLLSRPDVNPDQIGIIGISLGGYYAPRAAAFESRLKLCVAWGGMYDAGAVFRRLYQGSSTNLSAPPNQLLWVSGASNLDEAWKVMDQMTLEGVIERIQCPLLVVHGGADHLVPLSYAERTVHSATGSPRADLIVFPPGEPGEQHCQVD